MFLVVNWICTGCVLDVVFVHILQKTIAITVKHQQLIISISFGISSIFKFQAYSSINYRPAIHHDTTSYTTSSHSHTPVDCLQKTTVFFVCSFRSETFFPIWVANSSGPNENMVINENPPTYCVYQGVWGCRGRVPSARSATSAGRCSTASAIAASASRQKHRPQWLWCWRGKIFRTIVFLYGIILTGCFEARDSLCAPRNPGWESEDPIDCNNRVIITSRWWCSFATIMP